MNTEKIALVKNSWQQVLPIKDTAAQFTPAVKDAWVEAYTTLASSMKQAAYGKT